MRDEQDKQETLSLMDQIDEAITADRFVTVDEAVAEVEKKGVFGEQFAVIAQRRVKKELVRSVLRRRKGDDGWSLFANIQQTGPDGKPRRVYMREKYMRPKEYKQVVQFWKQYAYHGIEMANGWADRCNTRYSEQLPLPFPKDDDAPGAMVVA